MVDKVKLKVANSNRRLKESLDASADSEPRKAGRARALELVKYLLQLNISMEDPRYPIWIQLIRSTNSVGANLSEGSARGGGQDWIRFAKISRGSAEESIFHAECLDLINVDQFKQLRVDCDQLLNELLKDIEI